MLTGDFGQGMLIPFSVLPLLLTLVAAGLWTDQLGDREAWRLPAAYVTGLVAGILLVAFSLNLPYPAIGAAVGVIVLGVMVALSVSLHGFLGMLVAAAVALWQGYAELGTAAFPLVRWIGLGVGVILALAAGIGLGAMFGRALGNSAIRFLGLVIAALGLWLLFQVI